MTPPGRNTQVSTVSPPLPPVSFRITGRGWLFGVLSILIGFLGYYRKELASILWGIGLGSIWASALLVTTWASVLLNNRRFSILRDLEFSHSKEEIYAGAPLPFSVSLPEQIWKRMGKIPGIILWYHYRVSAFQRRLYEWKAHLNPKSPSFLITPPPPLRGEYEGPIGILCVEDSFRFFQIDIPLPEEERLLVLPEPLDHFPLPDLTAHGGTIIREHKPTHTVLEELEIRKYIPGDDPRRLHWKLYAHSGELFLRVGEQDPPPRDTFHLHFDPTLPLPQDPSLSLEAVDRMASIGARVILDLSRMGKRILLSTTAQWFQPPWIEVEGGHPEVGLAELAKLSPLPVPHVAEKDTRLPGKGTKPPEKGTRPPHFPAGASAGPAANTGMPLLSSYPVTGRILFLFAPSPASEWFGPFQSLGQETGLSQVAEVSRLEESSLWVIRIHLPRGQNYA